MEWMRDNYMESPDQYDDIHLSPDRATIDQLRGLPPTLIEVAENDILRDGGEELGRKLDEAGVYVTTIRYNRVTHDWGLLNGFAGLSPVKSLAMFSGAMLKKIPAIRSHSLNNTAAGRLIFHPISPGCYFFWSF